VALKVLDRDHDAQAALREARLAAALTHPNIVALYDVLAHEGAQVLVMEYLPGGNLNALCTTGHASLNEVIHLLIDVASGLEAAAQVGLIHRDLSSANVLRDVDGRAKLADFGLALLRDRPPDFATLRSGTLTAVTPEQLRGDALSNASDLFCLGLLAFRLLTGRHPFFTQGQLDTERLLRGPRPNLKQYRPDLPLRLQSLIEALLAYEPTQRPRSALLVRESLLECWAQLPVPLHSA
jgi:serine/threonine protein kinase